MSRLHLLLCLALAGTVAAGGRASAQDVTDQSTPAPAFISSVTGSANLIRDGRAEAASSNLPLLEGDRLRTEAGRLEVFLPDGSLLHLDQSSTVDLLSGSLVRLSSGRVIFVVSGRADARPRLDYQIDASAGSVRVMRPGEYRVSLVAGRPGPDLELAVVRGEAVLTTEHGSVTVRAGQVSTAGEGYAPAYPETFNSARLDDFGRWSADQLNAHLGYASRPYLPSEVQVYASTFDRYGTWDTVEPYGHVWYPTVQVGWRPYYDGYWRAVGPYGWTWIGYDPWCWPTHHYGRWGMGARGWYWIPGRSWGAAWVSWGIGADYLSWCPLGWNNRAVLGFSVGFGSYRGHPYDPWSAWTVVPRHAFGTPTRVPAVAVRGDQLHAVARAGIAVQPNAPPVQPRRAVPRAQAPPGGFSAAAVPTRGTALPRNDGPTNGPPARDTRPMAVPRYTGIGSSNGGSRAVASQPLRAPAAIPRTPQNPISTYDRTRGYALERDARAPAVLPRAVEPPASRGQVPLGAERGGAEATPRVSGQARWPESRQVPGAPSYERQRAVPAYERQTPAPVYQRQAPSAAYDRQSSAPVYQRQAPSAAYDRQSSAPVYQRQAPSANERQAPARMAVPRAPERSWSPPAAASSPRPQRAAPPASAGAPAAVRSPQRAAPPSAPARSRGPGDTPRKR